MKLFHKGRAYEEDMRVGWQTALGRDFGERVKKCSSANNFLLYFDKRG